VSQLALPQLTKGMIYRGLQSDRIPEDTAKEVIEYHAKNPHLFERFEHYARAVAEAGKQVGAMAIVNRIRWEAEIEKKGEFKINNNIAPYFARIFEIKYPEFSGIFEKRRAKGANQIV